MPDGRVLAEKLVELVLERLRAAIEADHARHVVLDAEGVLPPVGLRVVIKGNVLGIEWDAPGTVRLLAAEETGRGVEHVLVVLRAFGEERGVLGFAERLGHLGDAPIVVGKFQRAGSGLRPLVGFGGHVAELLV